ncbi:hypothetical protein ACFX2I_028042 [Malus domestica]
MRSVSVWRHYRGCDEELDNKWLQRDEVYKWWLCKDTTRNRDVVRTLTSVLRDNSDDDFEHLCSQSEKRD